MGIDNTNIVEYYEDALLILSVRIGGRKLQLQRIYCYMLMTRLKILAKELLMLSNRMSSSLNNNNNTLYQDGLPESLDKKFFLSNFFSYIGSGIFPPCCVSSTNTILATSNRVSRNK